MFGRKWPPIMAGDYTGANKKFLVKPIECASRYWTASESERESFNLFGWPVALNLKTFYRRHTNRRVLLNYWKLLESRRWKAERAFNSFAFLRKFLTLFLKSSDSMFKFIIVGNRQVWRFKLFDHRALSCTSYTLYSIQRCYRSQSS